MLLLLLLLLKDQDRERVLLRGEMSALPNTTPASCGSTSSELRERNDLRDSNMASAPPPPAAVEEEEEESCKPSSELRVRSDLRRPDEDSPAGEPRTKSCDGVFVVVEAAVEMEWSMTSKPDE